MKAIVIFPEKNQELETIRKKYNPFYEGFKTHITLIQPFEAPEKEINERIRAAIKGIKPFKITLEGLKKSSKEYFLYLLVKEGKDKILKIHKNLCQKLKAPLSAYPPHVTLGVFTTKTDIDKAVKELKRKNLRFKTAVNAIYLLNLNKDFSLRSIKEFKL